MKRQTMMAAAIAAAMMTMTVSLFAAEQTAPARKSEPIYGYRMMTDQERNDFRERMRNAPSAEERQKVRDEHRKLMEKRAAERGVTLPEPRAPGAGKGGGKGGGKGPGYGPGGEGKGYGKGPGPRTDCPAGQECPGPGAGKGPGAR